ncbi:hypothetical protein PF004_g15987 [Phytophthora fragariae]|uniref:Uncharacterized protein n=1 Tax=Phytophthora fragariae TaxID=53985 RepID=A0A6G0NJS7_9STRA|nr:hypothetical protein PF004_g15987 [Phytophthora fragariae]
MSHFPSSCCAHQTASCFPRRVEVHHSRPSTSISAPSSSGARCAHFFRGVLHHKGKVPAKWTALKAPDLEDEPKERQVPAGIKTEASNPTWNGADLEFRYHRKELQDFMTHNPIMQILRLTQIGDQTGPVTAPASTDNKLEAIKILMNLLWEAGLVAGTFDADDLFRPDLRIFQLSTKELFDKLKVIVGEKVTDPSTTSSPDSPTQIGSTGDRTSSPFVSAAEADSDASSESRRMSLGPTGAAMLQARSKVSRQKPARAKAKKTSGAVSKPTTSPPHPVITTDDPTTSTDKMESHFQAAMSRFLREQQISVPNLVAGLSRIQEPEMWRWCLPDRMTWRGYSGSTTQTTWIFPRRPQQRLRLQQSDPRRRH